MRMRPRRAISLARSQKSFSGLETSKQAVISLASRSHTRSFVARSSSETLRWTDRAGFESAERSGASARTDVHFMGRHVVSVQWRKVWFFPGNFGLFNRDPISRSTRPAWFELRQRPPPHPFPHNSHASRSSLYTSDSSLFRSALLLRLERVLVRFVPSLRLIVFVLLGAALFRLISSSSFSAEAAPSLRKEYVYLSSSLQITALNIAYCPTFLRRASFDWTRINWRHIYLRKYKSTCECICIFSYWDQRVCTNEKLCVLASRAIFT